VLVAFPTILQLETPPHLMGRVYSTASAIPTTLQMVAPIVGAAVASAVGVSWVLLVSGGALSALGMAVLLVAPRVGMQASVPPAPELGLGLSAAEPDVVAHISSVSRQRDPGEGR
jgi:hypothetical protein